MTIRGILGAMLKPSHWRVAYAMRQALTIAVLTLPWFTSHTYLLPGTHPQPYILASTVFSQQGKYVGESWKNAGKAVFMGLIGAAFAAGALWVPDVVSTVWGAALYMGVVTAFLEALVMAQIFGLAKPNHTLTLVQVARVFVNPGSTNTLLFWTSMPILVPLTLCLSSITFWPRYALQLYHQHSLYILNEMSVGLALCQRIAFESSVQPWPKDLATNDAKVLAKLSEMEDLVAACESELWLVDVAPLAALRKDLARGWFLVAQMKALLLEGSAHHPHLGHHLGEALVSVHLHVAGLAVTLQHGPSHVVPSQIIASDAAQMLKMAVRATTSAMHNPSEWVAGEADSRLTTFLVCCSKFSEYLDPLTESVHKASYKKTMADGGFHIARTMMVNLSRHIKWSLWDTWWTAISKFQKAWENKAWRGSLRNILAISSAVAFSQYWVTLDPQSHGFWLAMTVIVLSTETMGQSLLKGALRFAGVLIAYLWALPLVYLGPSDIDMWMAVLVVLTFAMAYLGRDKVVGYMGNSGFITFYVIGLGLYGESDPSTLLLTLRALTVAAGVGWALTFFVLVFPQDGLYEPMVKLSDACELLYKAMDIIARHKDDNLSASALTEAGDLLVQANLKHKAFEQARTHARVQYFVVGAVRRAYFKRFTLLDEINRRIRLAVVALRLLHLVGCRETSSDVRARVAGPASDQLIEVLQRLNTVRESTIKMPYRAKPPTTTHQHNNNDSLNSTMTHVDSSGGLLSHQSHPVASACSELLRAHFKAAQTYMDALGGRELEDEERRAMVRWDGFVMTFSRAARALAAISNPEEAFVDSDLQLPKPSRPYPPRWSVHPQES